MEVLLDPNSLFINEEKWHQEHLRDAFLTDLFDILDAITTLEVSKIHWSEEIELLLWSNPQLNPWLSHNNYKFSMIPIIYNKLQSKRVFNLLSDEFCEIIPDLSYSYINDDIRDVFIRTANTLLLNNVEFSFFLGIPNKNIEELNIINEICDYTPVLLKSKKCYFKNITFCDIIWPVKYSIESIALFNKCLDIVRLIEIPEKKWLYQFRFNESFINSIIHLDHNLRYNLIYKCAKRLCQTNLESEQDGVLHDEYIVQVKQRRFRITPRPTSRRVHYSFADGVFVFLKFYDVGEHDNGL